MPSRPSPTLTPNPQGKPVPFTVDPGPRQRPPFGRFQEITFMEAGSTGCRVGPLHRPTDHRRRPGPPPPAALDTASILIMTPGVVHAWMLRTAHAPGSPRSSGASGWSSPARPASPATPLGPVQRSCSGVSQRPCAPSATSKRPGTRWPRNFPWPSQHMENVTVQPSSGST